MSRTDRVIWILILAFTLTVLSPLVSSRTDSLVLSDPEYKAVEEAVTAREAYRRRFETASNAALNSPLKCEQAVPALSELQTSFAFKIASEARYDSVLSAQRLAHSCVDCEHSPDFKSLVRKAKTP